MSTAKLGDRVQVQCHRVSRESSPLEPQSPWRLLEFTVGSKEVIPGISLGVVGMAEGQQKRMTLEPQEAYGSVRPRLIREVPRARFAPHLDLCVGRRFTSSGATTRRRRRVLVVELKRDTVVVDGNHPLAGKTVELEVQLVSVNAFGAHPGRDHHDAGGES